MIDWVVYYAKKTTFTSEDGDPVDAPPWGVQVIAQKNDRVGRELIYRSDYYLYIWDGWIGIGKDGLNDYLAHFFIEIKAIKIGRQLSSIDFRAILEMANNDPVLPPKSGWLQNEPRG